MSKYEQMTPDEIRHIYKEMDEIGFDSPLEAARIQNLRRLLNSIVHMRELAISLEIARRNVAKAKAIAERDTII